MKSNLSIPVAAATGSRECTARTIRSTLTAAMQRFLVLPQAVAMGKVASALKIEGLDISDPALVAARMGFDATAVAGAAHAVFGKIRTMTFAGLQHN